MRNKQGKKVGPIRISVAQFRKFGIFMPSFLFTTDSLRMVYD